MSKIRVIDLLNKIANREEVPKKIQYVDEIFEFNENDKTYKYETRSGKYLLLQDVCMYSVEGLNNTVEIIEEEPEIDIQEIKKLEENKEIFNDKYGSLILQNNILQNRGAINQLIKAVKKLDHQINNMKGEINWK